MNPSQSSDAGYIPLSTYIEEIEYAEKKGQWKLPFTRKDRLHLWLLKQVVRLSVFSKLLFVEHDHTVSPTYTLLLGFLRKQKIMDILYERDLHSQGYHSFYIQKFLNSNGKEHIVYGQGASPDRETALSIAMGEMLERAIGGWMDQNKNIIIESPAKLLENTPLVYPPQYHRFLDVQKEKYPELRHDASVPMRWVYGKTSLPKKLLSFPDK